MLLKIIQEVEDNLELVEVELFEVLQLVEVEIGLVEEVQIVEVEVELVEIEKVELLKVVERSCYFELVKN